MEDLPLQKNAARTNGAYERTKTSPKGTRVVLAIILVALLLSGTLAAVATFTESEADDATAVQTAAQDSLSTQQNPTEHTPGIHKSPINNAPIRIRGDARLIDEARDNGWPGTGTHDDPIIIDAPNRNTIDEPVLVLADLARHVVVRDADLATTESGHAIVVHNVTSLRLHHAKIAHTDPEQAAIVIRDSGHVIIAGGQITTPGTALLARNSHVTIQANSIAAGETGLVLRSDDGQEHLIIVDDVTFTAPTTPMTPESETTDPKDTESTTAGLDDSAIIHRVIDARNVHLTVEDSRFEVRAGTTILADASKTTLVRNAFGHSAHNAVVITRSDGTSITHNDFEGAEASCIRIIESDQVIIKQNAMTSCRFGVQTKNDKGTVIEANTIVAPERGIITYTSTSLHATRNVIQGADQAIDLHDNTAALVERNIVTESITSAIDVFGGAKNNINLNIIKTGANLGIYVARDAQETSISSNDITATAYPITITGGATDSQTQQNMIRGPGTTGIAITNATRTTIIGDSAMEMKYGIVIGDGAVSTQASLFHVQLDLFGMVIGPGAEQAHIHDATILQNTFGVHISGTGAHTVTQNDIRQNTEGLKLFEAEDQTIQSNLFRGNRLAVHYINSTDNMFFDNFVESDHLPGDRNIILRASFGNHWNITKTAGTNIVGGPWIAGNYWHDYEGADADDDRLGDVPYEPIPYVPFVADGIAQEHLPVGPLDLHPLIDQPRPSGPIKSPLRPPI